MWGIGQAINRKMWGIGYSMKPYCPLHGLSGRMWGIVPLKNLNGGVIKNKVIILRKGHK
jgi:hypothetical protein